MKKVLGIVLLFFAFAFAGCNNNQAPLEYGFGGSGSGDPENSYKCGYVLPQTEFEKNNVFLDVYYGAINGFTQGINVVMRLYFCRTGQSDPLFEDAYLIKELDSEDRRSDKYIWKGKDGYHERMVIPEELFDRPKGGITFVMVDYIEGFHSCNSFNVNFTLEKDIVTLSVPTK